MEARRRRRRATQPAYALGALLLASSFATFSALNETSSSSSRPSQRALSSGPELMHVFGGVDHGPQPATSARPPAHTQDRSPRNRTRGISAGLNRFRVHNTRDRHHHRHQDSRIRGPDGSPTWWGNKDWYMGEIRKRNMELHLQAMELMDEKVKKGLQVPQRTIVVAAGARCVVVVLVVRWCRARSRARSLLSHPAATTSLRSPITLLPTLLPTRTRSSHPPRAHSPLLPTSRSLAVQLSAGGRQMAQATDRQLT